MIGLLLLKLVAAVIGVCATVLLCWEHGRERR
jgi:hypothetical protein